MFDFAGKVAFVAGGAGYLAFPVCEAFGQCGASVVIADINAERLGQSVEDLSETCGEDRVMGVQMDISDPASIEQAVGKTVERFGKIDVLVNAAFCNAGKVLGELNAEDWDRTNRVNITGAFLLAREAERHMDRGSSIVFYSSMYGIVPPDTRVYHEPMRPNPIEYGAAKAAVLQMTRYLAGVYGPKGIRVNSIAPGPFPPPAKAETDPGFVERLADRTMLGRTGERNETAGAVVFLASEQASYITGVTLPVDGGWTAW